MRLRKFWSLPATEKFQICEAAMLLPIVNLSIKVIEFKRIHSFLRNRGIILTQAANHDDELEAIARSVSRAAAVMPMESLCLSRSIVEFIMLRRRGIPAVIVAGVVSSADSSLSAHAWVELATIARNERSDNCGFVPVLRIGELASAASASRD